MRTVRFLAVLVALLLPFLATSTAAAEEPTVSLTGRVMAGQWVTAALTGIEGEATYEWLVDDVLTPSTHPFDPSTPSPWPDRFFLREEHLGAQVAVRAVLDLADGSAMTLVSEAAVVAEGVILANPPVIVGKMLIGETLSVDPKVVYPLDGVEISSYQWFHSGYHRIANATGPTLRLTEDLRGFRDIRVELTATKPGWRPSQQRSVRSEAVVLPAKIQTGSLRLVSLRAGEYGWYEGWRREGDELDTVEWLIDGKLVSRAANGGLVLNGEWVGKSLEVKVTRSRADVAAVTIKSPAVIILPPRDPQFVRVEPISAAAGWPIEVEVPETPGYRTTITWYRSDAYNGRRSDISGATSRLYRLTAADVGHDVGVRVELRGASGETVEAFDGEVTSLVTFNLYTTPGEHLVNDRRWRTTCEKYSQTLRCRTDIVATQVVEVDGRWTQRTGWVFNNLTYLPLPSTHTWAGNPLAHNGEWTDGAGRQWRTDCNPETVGQNTCRTYITAHVTQAHARRGGGWDYVTSKVWVFNNMLYTR